LQLLDAERIRVRAPQDIDITLFVNDRVFLDPASVDEIVALAALADTLAALNVCGFFGDAPARIGRIVLTPDFHRGAGIPVGTVIAAHGFVLPKAVGTDIGCGMRLLATDITDAADLDARHIFFEGGRDIPMSAAHCIAIFRPVSRA
jgi:tRNA-splicing ligase RtcB